jgi:hypothetical protein
MSAAGCHNTNVQKTLRGLLEGWFPGATQSYECSLNEHDGVWCDYGTGIYLYENERADSLGCRFQKGQRTPSSQRTTVYTELDNAPSRRQKLAARPRNEKPCVISPCIVLIWKIAEIATMAVAKPRHKSTRADVPSHPPKHTENISHLIRFTRLSAGQGPHR